MIQLLTDSRKYDDNGQWIDVEKRDYPDHSILSTIQDSPHIDDVEQVGGYIHITVSDSSDVETVRQWLIDNVDHVRWTVKDRTITKKRRFDGQTYVVFTFDPLHPADV